MLNIFCKIKFIEDAVLKYAFTQQRKPKDEQFARMEFKFLDSTGKRYYRYFDDFDIPVQRMEQLQLKLREIESRINLEQLDEWVEAVERILSKNDKQKANVEAIQMLGALRERRKVLYEPELLMRACCILYIREDQNPVIWDEVLEDEKYQQLNKDKVGGLYDFFYMSGLKTFLPSLKDMQKDWMSFSDNQKSQMDAFTNMIESVNTSTSTAS